jgi:hypothetical protein
MSRFASARFIALFGFAWSIAATSTGWTAEACDRACLHGIMDDYLAALVAHDPHRLKTFSNVKFTENTNRMVLGDGLWQTAGALGTFKLYLEDTETSEAAFYGSIKENGLTALLGVRLKERDRRLTEIETFVVRQATGIHGTFDALVTAPPEWEQSLPASERASRKELMHAADQYFNGIEQGNGNIVPVADDCIRIENGAQTAPMRANGTRPAMTIAESFNTHRFDYIHEVTNRRFQLVDPERGLVYVVALFQHPGNIKPQLDAVAGPGAPTHGFNLSSYPNTTQIIETFQVRGGKIHRIFAYVSLLPYRQPPGW